jgi:exosortase
LAVATLELLGITVVREGHTMLLNDTVPVAVAEACSGLRMLTAFIVVAFVLAYVVNRPRWQKAILMLSCIPVAIVCNQIRLVVTAILFLVVSNQVGEKFFHDFAGLTMMPMAVLILAAELWILSHLVIEDEHERTKTCV